MSEKKLSFFPYCALGLVLKTAQGPLGAQRPRVPGHSVGLGRESGPRSNPTWAESGLGGARTPLAVGSNPTAIHDSSAIKIGHRTAPIKP